MSIKNIYKTVWEIKKRTLLDLSIQRGPYIDQSQSINVFLAIPTFKQLASLHMYAWKMGAKTGMYYLRSKSAADAIKFTIKKRKISNEREENINKNSVCRLNGNNEECLSCS